MGLLIWLKGADVEGIVMIKVVEVAPDRIAPTVSLKRRVSALC